MAEARNYLNEFPFNGMTSLPNLMKFYQVVQKLMGGQTDRQEGNLISLHFSFGKESRLKIQRWVNL
jgi:hypothetical protein